MSILQHPVLSDKATVRQLRASTNSGRIARLLAVCDVELRTVPHGGRHTIDYQERAERAIRELDHVVVAVAHQRAANEIMNYLDSAGQFVTTSQALALTRAVIRAYHQSLATAREDQR